MLLSMSLSATILTGILVIIRKTVRNRLSHTIRYYSWLPVLFRALLPFASGGAWLNRIFRQYYETSNYYVKPMVFGEEGRQIIIGSNVHAPALQSHDRFTLLMILWLLVAVGLLIKKITAYRSFYKYIRAGWQPVESPELLDILGDICKKMNINQRIDLCINPLISSPLLLGIMKPVIVLPAIPQHPDLLYYILTHELVHHKRRDIVLIWLTQLTLCVHWFNPLFYLIRRQAAKDRELSCDEQVIKGLTDQDKITYGRTLLETFIQNGSYQEHDVTSALLENKSLLRIRLEAIETDRESPANRFWTGAVFLVLGLSFLVLGVYTPAA